MERETISPEMIRMIAKLFEKAIEPIRLEVKDFKDALSRHCMEDAKKEKERIELQIASQEVISSARDLIREMKDAPEKMHGWAKTFFDEKTESEIKRIDARMDDHITNHVQYREFRLKRWQIALGLPAVAIMVITAIYNVWVFIRSVIPHVGG
jgi:4-hydroxyphenylpyruvate dioxygenase-like putative hemolysin